MNQIKPLVVTICGSTRFREQMAVVNRSLTLAGMAVLAPGVFAHAGDVISEQEKAALDTLHLAKIRMADAVVVVAPAGYIGESTAREVEYALGIGRVTWFVYDLDQVVSVITQLQSSISVTPSNGEDGR